MRKPKTLGYRQIAAILIGEIQSGTLTLAQPFPTEMELVDRFDVGRNTVREALRDLQDQGYIKRRRGARSELTGQNPETAFVNTVSAVEELLEYAKQTRLVVLGSETMRVDEGLSRKLEVPVGGEWVRMNLLRYRDTATSPLSYSEVYVVPKYADAIPDFQAGTELFALIEARHGVSVSRIDQEIEATLVDANIASRLQVAIGTAALTMRSKFYTNEGELVEIGLVTFPASRYRLRLSLNRKTHIKL